MKPTDTPVFSLIGKFSRVAKLWRQLENKTRQFGTGEDMSGAEIHLVEMIGRDENLSVTNLAGRLGITKGAVSHTLKKLENKGIIAKEPDPRNNSRITVGLTTKGRVTYYAHLHWHETMDGSFREYLLSLPEDKVRFMDEFLSIFEQFLKKRV
jgi:DNA-binding MarR family transcriptional regulator